ncbi:MAG TPA: polysaccharide biosynthesis/export family protein [Chthoniobacteraceae bacterium]|nr:polysaccharide biosynthesis/export family protein [Chthoniobacteraceae bacterium]
MTASVYNYLLRLSVFLVASSACALHSRAQDSSRPGQAELASPVTVVGTNSMDVLDDHRKLVAGDRLSYRVLQEQLAPQAIVVSDSGEAEVPLIGRVPAQGRTCKELAFAIKQDLEKDYFYHATVIIGLDTASSKSRGRVFLTGQVRTQGAMEIPVTGNFTLSKAIMQAGGFGDFANEKKVKVLRTQTDGKTAQTYVVDVGEILKGNVDKDMVLQPDDVIIVPERAVTF